MSQEVKRYNFEPYEYESGGFKVEHKEGDYVEYVDYAALKKELETLKKDHATVLKYGVEGQREINRKLTVEINAVKESNKALVEKIREISDAVHAPSMSNHSQMKYGLISAQEISDEALEQHKQRMSNENKT